MRNLCGEIKTHIYVQQSFSANPAVYGIMWETGTAGQATDDNKYGACDLHL